MQVFLKVKTHPQTCMSVNVFRSVRALNPAAHRGGGARRGPERSSSWGSAVPLGSPAELPRHGRRSGPRSRRQLGQRVRGVQHAVDTGRVSGEDR